MVIISVNLPNGHWEHFHQKKQYNWAKVYWNGKWRVEGLYHSEEEASIQYQNYTTFAIRTIMGLTIPKE